MKLQSLNQRDFFWNIWGQETRKLSPSVYQVRNNQEKLEQVLQTELSLNENEFFFFLMKKVRITMVVDVVMTIEKGVILIHQIIKAK